MDRRTWRLARPGLILLVLASLCAALLAPPGAAAPPSLQTRCVEAGTAPLAALSGRAFIENHAGFSNPRLNSTG